jgi:phosphoadenosine phosphosulfate reductase
VRLVRPARLWQALRALGSPPQPRPAHRHHLLPGRRFLRAGQREVDPDRGRSRRFDDLDYLHDIGELDLNISGCMNSCGHHHVGHIGILGVDKHGEEWYQVSIGGADGSDAGRGRSAIGKVIGPSFKAEDMPDVIRAVTSPCGSARPTTRGARSRMRPPAARRRRLPEVHRRPRLLDRVPAAFAPRLQGRTPRDRRRAARPDLLHEARRLRRLRAPRRQGHPQDARALLDTFSETYQGSWDQPVPAFRRVPRGQAPRFAHERRRDRHGAVGRRRTCSGSTSEVAVDVLAKDAIERLAAIACEFPRVGFASSLGAEDQVLTDLIFRANLPIAIFTLDTGRLHADTVGLIAAWPAHYGKRLDVFRPQPESVRHTSPRTAANAFYESVDLRKSCCFIRKVEPLRRALASKRCVDHRPAPRPVRDARRLPLREHDATHGIEKFNPLADWSEDDVWTYIRSREFPTTRCTTAAIRRSAATPARAHPCRRGRPRRPLVVGVSDSKECGLHIASPLPGAAGNRIRHMNRAPNVRDRRIPGGERLSADDTRPPAATSTGSSPRPSTSCAKWRPSAATRRCCSRAARTPSSCCASPRRRSVPGRFPFPLLHIDTGHNFPR